MRRDRAPRTPLLTTVHGIEESEECAAALLLRAGRARVTAVSESSAEGVTRHRLAPDVELVEPGVDIGQLERAALAAPATRDPRGSPARRLCWRATSRQGCRRARRGVPAGARAIPGAGWCWWAAARIPTADRRANRRARHHGCRAPRRSPAQPGAVSGRGRSRRPALAPRRPPVVGARGIRARTCRRRNGRRRHARRRAHRAIQAGSSPRAAGGARRGHRRGAAGSGRARSSCPRGSRARATQLLDGDHDGPHRGALRRRDRRAPAFHATARVPGRARLPRVRVAGARCVRWTGSGVRILGYHRVANAVDSLAVSPARFREQMRARRRERCAADPARSRDRAAALACPRPLRVRDLRRRLPRQPARGSARAGGVRHPRDGLLPSRIIDGDVPSTGTTTLPRALVGGGGRADRRWAGRRAVAHAHPPAAPAGRCAALVRGDRGLEAARSRPTFPTR